MESLDLIQFVHSIHRYLNYSPFHIVSNDHLPDLEIIYHFFQHVQDNRIKEKSSHALTTRHHISISLAIVDTFLLRQEQHIRTLVYRYLQHILLAEFSSHDINSDTFDHARSSFQRLVDSIEKTHPHHSTRLIYENYVASPLFDIDSMIEFHKILHITCLNAFLILDLYRRFDAKRVDEFIDIVEKYNDVVPTYNTVITEELLMSIGRHPSNTLVELVEKFIKKYNEIQYTKVEPRRAYAILATLFYYFYMKQDRLRTKSYDYMTIFEQRVKTKEDIVYEEHLYPFFYEHETADLYYVPVIRIEPSLALEYYIEYNILKKYDKDIIEKHIEGDLLNEVLYLDSDDTSLKHFDIEIR